MPLLARLFILAIARWFLTPKCYVLIASCCLPVRQNNFLQILDRQWPLVESTIVELLQRETTALCSLIFLAQRPPLPTDRKSTRLNSSHLGISYAVFCLKKK